MSRYLEGFAMDSETHPVIIQGGMGVAVSAWRLARAVSLTGHLGVVSGTALDTVLARRLQLGDPGGHMRRALASFPLPGVAESILERYFVPGGKSPDEPFVAMKVLAMNPTRLQTELVVAANFVEVFLAKENHDGLVGINYLEKIRLPTLPSLYGAMLARVDYVLMGAGIPTAIPGILDRLREGLPVELPILVADAESEDRFVVHFDPRQFFPNRLPPVQRPKFLAIVASSTLANMLVRKASGRVDGFVVEGPTAGGHNAPPRGKGQLNDRGEPIYSERDSVDPAAMRRFERPFWLAGSYGTPDRVHEALAAGAAGVQVGTAFAFCLESGLREDIRRQVLEMSRQGDLDVFTDPAASPTGFPFKVLRLDNTLADESLYEDRERHCDLGFLRQGYRRQDGSVGWRCPAEPENVFVKKGGERHDTVGRKCICNCLLSNVGLDQVVRDGSHEKPMVTCGDDLTTIARILERQNSESYSAADVIAYLLPATETSQLTSC